MNNANVNAAITTLISTMEKGRGEFGPFDRDAVEYFRSKFTAILDGKIGHAGNPHGYFIIGSSPQSKRGQSLTLKQFEYCLAKGYTTKAHPVCRGLSTSVLAEALTAVKAGVYASYARNTSSLGDVAMRNVANSLARDARKGNDVSNKTSALLLALTDADAAESALAFIRQSVEKIKTAVTIQHDEWLDSIIESIPCMDSVMDQDDAVTHWVTGILEELPEVSEEDERIVTAAVKRVAKKKAGKK